MGIFKRSTVAIVAALALLAGSTAEAQWYFQGTTAGCFTTGGSCYSGGSSFTYNGTTVTFTDGVFQGNATGNPPTLGIGGTPTQNFGKFAVNAGPSNGTFSTAFELTLAFTSPAGSTPTTSGIYKATVAGQVVGAADGSVSVKFANPLIHSYVTGTGAPFTAEVAKNIFITPGSSTFLTGEIVASPEPGTMMLLGSGLASLVPAFRRRRKNSSV